MIPRVPALTRLLTVALVLTPLEVCARMYQWVSPSAGSVQLSGEPPAWYRSAQGGPRVHVFDNGNLVDDTAIELPRAQREELREAAFRESEHRQRTEALKRLERAARQEQFQREELARLEEARREREAQQAAAVAQQSQATQPASTPLGEGALDDAAVARLKAIISEYDRRGSANPAE